MTILKKIVDKIYTVDNKFIFLNKSYLPRWVVILLDFILCALSLGIVYLFSLAASLPFANAIPLLVQAFFILGCSLFYFFIFKTYSGIIRHSTFADIIKLGFASLFTGLTIVGINFISYYLTGYKLFSAISVILYTLLSFIIMLLLRILVREVYKIIRYNSSLILKKRIVIIGLVDHSISLGKALIYNPSLPFELVGFLTKKKELKGFKIIGKPLLIYTDNFSENILKYNIQGVIIINESLLQEEKKEIINMCLENHVEIFTAPLLENLNSEDDLNNYIKPVQIEDLLERDPIYIDTRVIEKDLHNKTILVTGGAGSIGSEIVKQIAVFKPKLIVVLDQAESPLYELELHLKHSFPELTFVIELANISNMYRLEMLFAKYKFDIVYHAAAYKHVPLIERNPHEAVYVNILGTVNLSVLAINNKVNRFVMVSTDKAVNPTNVMGASKRAAEMYVQSLQNSKELHTKFITTRFGNVLDSNGSVIPLFKKLIKQRRPLTVTHKDIIRYFMTIPEACQLVLQAGTMGQGGEIFIFDMGKPIRILDMAERMIRLSGLVPYKDIDIIISGLRPGEKLYEELLNDTSIVLPTHHPKIMISKMPTDDFDVISTKIKTIIRSATRHKDRDVVMLLKDLIPEYKSDNSEFEALDHR